LIVDQRESLGGEEQESMLGVVKELRTRIAFLNFHASLNLHKTKGSTPLQVIERGESDRLWRMIWALRIGNSGD
jgi:hypothetical protein